MTLPDATRDGFDWPTVPNAQAELDRLHRDLAHLTLHTGAADGRVGKAVLWRVVAGGAA